MAFQAEDLLNLLQSQSKKTDQDILPSLAAFGIGVLVGAGAALLFAPASGEELRDRIAGQVDDLKESALAAVRDEGADTHPAPSN